MIVPSYAGSGRLTLVTPKGTAVSTDDFFVPPSPYVASDVVATGRLTFSTPMNVVIGTAEKIGLVVFDGTAGQRISLKVVPPSSGTVTLYQANLGHVDGHSTGIGTTLMEPPLLPTTGTYQFKLDPNFTNTGTYTITLYDVPTDVTDTITADGSSKGVTIETPGQNASLSFSGTASQRVSLNVSSGPSGSVALVKPDGSTQESVVSGTLAKFMEPQVLATTGTYAIKVNPTNAATGSLTLNLYDVPTDHARTLTIGDPAIPVSFDPGQNGSFTFSGPTRARSRRLTTPAVGLRRSSIQCRGRSSGRTTCSTA